MLDLDELEARIAEGEKKNFFVAPLVKQLIAELREARKERAAVVAMLRGYANSWGTSPDEKRVLHSAVRHIQRGEHRREEGK